MTTESIKAILELVANGCDLIGMFILVVGSLRFLFHYIAFEVKRPPQRPAAMRELRLHLGSYIALALEFLIVSDVIDTALTRTLDAFFILAILVTIRTAIAYFLGKEMKELKQ